MITPTHEDKFRAKLHPSRQRLLEVLRKQDIRTGVLGSGKDLSLGYRLFLESLPESNKTKTENGPDDSLASQLSVRIARILDLLQHLHALKDTEDGAPAGSASVVRRDVPTSTFLHLCFEVSRLLPLLFPQCATLAKVLSKDMQNCFQQLMVVYGADKLGREFLSGFTRQKACTAAEAIWHKNEQSILRYLDFAQRMLRLRCGPGVITVTAVPDHGLDTEPHALELDALLRAYNESVRPIHNAFFQQISEQLFRFALSQHVYRSRVGGPVTAAREVYMNLDRICNLLSVK